MDTPGESLAYLPRPAVIGTSAHMDADAYGAVECLERSTALFAEAGMEHNRALALFDLARVLTTAGRDDQARVLRQEAREILTRLDLALLLAQHDTSA